MQAPEPYQSSEDEARQARMARVALFFRQAFAAVIVICFGTLYFVQTRPGFSRQGSEHSLRILIPALIVLSLAELGVSLLLKQLLVRLACWEAIAIYGLALGMLGLPWKYAAIFMVVALSGVLTVQGTLDFPQAHSKGDEPRDA